MSFLKNLFGGSKLDGAALAAILCATPLAAQPLSSFTVARPSA